MLAAAAVVAAVYGFSYYYSRIQVLVLYRWDLKSAEIGGKSTHIFNAYFSLSALLHAENNDGPPGSAMDGICNALVPPGGISVLNTTAVGFQLNRNASRETQGTFII